MPFRSRVALGLCVLLARCAEKSAPVGATSVSGATNDLGGVPDARGVDSSGAASAANDAGTPPDPVDGMIDDVHSSDSMTAVQESAANDADSASRDSTGATDSGRTLRDGSLGPDASLGPLDLSSSAIYSIFIPIFSQAATLASVSADLPRIRDLGFNVVWLLPVTPVGQAVGGHPSFGSPYSVKDYYAVNPSFGTMADLKALVSTAHQLGVRVLLDEVLNHTSWDNALVSTHPEYYVHTDGNPQNVASIAQAFTFSDVAQLDYKSNNGLSKYMAQMLAYWIKTCDVDGFRFDSADNPFGAGRLIPASFWQALRPQLESVKAGVVMLGEEQDPALALAPFDLDYGWRLQGLYGPGGLRQVATGANAALLRQAWQDQASSYPPGMLHMTLLQDWDLPEDLTMYGGAPNTMAAAALTFTIDGVPLLFNGEEVGNDHSGNNTHTLIDWNGPNASTFVPFYKALVGLRRAHAALQSGKLTWVTNTVPAQVASYTRADASTTFLILVNFSSAAVSGNVSVPPAVGWEDISPTGSPGGTVHPPPPTFSLKPYDFAVFRAK